MTPLKADPIMNHEQSKEVTFERKEYDVTDTGCQTFLCLTCPLHWLPVFPGILGTKRLILEEEEAVLDIQCPLCSVHTRRPYGELGSVDRVNCFCCTGVSSALSRTMPLFVGSGCDVDKVSEIVAELKKRMKSRGDTGQINRTEEALQEIKNLRTEMSEMKTNMERIMVHLKVPTNLEIQR
eukprot:CAMPEP_0195291604 /NCGR_PEP_ID=MMETSP0707-20130614/7889_1 /TAXON_ID=33640 /ORGANISM="Asterionellopsis glacialis, Strain CCMP134" /LENGTH=180 /DNA_ID=CAMNT_0040351937 /DNA_START=102 /DNA_END=644 /DNA_ORIENTATION=+